MDKSAGCFMKRMYFVLMLFVLGGLCLVFLPVFHNTKPTDEHAILIINEKSTTSHARTSKDFIELPFIEVLQGLGYTINCVDDNVSYIVVNNKLFTLEKDPVTLMERGGSMNLLISPPGNKFFSCELSDGDVWLDHVTLKGVLYTMGIFVDISYSSGDQLVTISARNS